MHLSAVASVAFLAAVAQATAVTTYTGQATFWASPQPGTANACQLPIPAGRTVAMIHQRFFNLANTPASAVCGKHVNATYHGRTISATVVNIFGGTGPNGIGISRPGWTDWAPVNAGQVQPVTWSFTDFVGPSP